LRRYEKRRSFCDLQRQCKQRGKDNKCRITKAKCKRTLCPKWKDDREGRKKDFLEKLEESFGERENDA